MVSRTLQDTGTRPLATSHYCHNFTAIGEEPIRPSYQVRLAFPVTTKSDLRQRAQVNGDTITFRRLPEEGESVFAELAGLSSVASDHAVTVGNLKSGAGVRIEGDKPLARFRFWAVRSAVCPEPFVQTELAPREQGEWQTKYTFSVRDGSQ